MRSGVTNLDILTCSASRAEGECLELGEPPAWYKSQLKAGDRRYTRRSTKSVVANTHIFDSKVGASSVTLETALSRSRSIRAKPGGKKRSALALASGFICS